MLTVDNALKADKTYVRPISEYCSAYHLEWSKHTIDLIEEVKKNVIRIILSAPWAFSITTGRTVLFLLTLETRRYFSASQICAQKS